MREPQPSARGEDARPLVDRTSLMNGCEIVRLKIETRLACIVVTRRLGCCGAVKDTADRHGAGRCRGLQESMDVRECSAGSLDDGFCGSRHEGKQHQEPGLHRIFGFLGRYGAQRPQVACRCSRMVIRSSSRAHAPSEDTAMDALQCGDHTGFADELPEQSQHQRIEL